MPSMQAQLNTSEPPVSLPENAVPKARQPSDWLTAVLPPMLFALLAMLALLPALQAGELWSSRYDWRYFETMTEMARRTVAWYHQVPLWNPYSCGGEVGLANPQSMDAAPTFLLVLLFGTQWGFKLAMAVYLFCGQWGMLLLGKRLGLSTVPAMLAAVCFGLSGYQAMHLSVGHINFAGVSLFPLLLYCYDRALSRPHWVIPTAALAAWIALLGGTFTPVMAGEVLVFWATADALLPLSASATQPILRRLARNYGLLLLAGFLALLLGAMRMLPALQFVHDHPRPLFRRTPDVSLPRHLMLDLFAWRDLGPLAGRKYWSLEYTARLPLLSLPLLLGPLGLLLLSTLGSLRPRLAQLWSQPEPDLQQPQEPLTIPAMRLSLRLLLLLLLGLLLSMGNFAPQAPWSLLQTLPLLRDLRVPARHLVLVTLWAALLAGLGAQVLHNWLALRLAPKRRWLQSLMLGVLLLGCSGDAVAFFYHSFQGVFTVRLILPPGPTPFFHVQGHWSQMRELELEGHGVMGCDEEAPLQRAKSLELGNVPQARLAEPDAGRILGSEVTPNRRTVTLELARSTPLLLLNSNWNEHFVTRTPNTAIQNVAGQLAVEISHLAPGQQTVVVQYAPRSFTAGLWITALAAPLCLAWFLRQQRRNQRQRTTDAAIARS